MLIGLHPYPLPSQMKKDTISITYYDPSYFEDWFAMSSLLYPDSDPEIGSRARYATVFIAKKGDETIGFITLSEERIMWKGHVLRPLAIWKRSMSGQIFGQMGWRDYYLNKARPGCGNRNVPK